MIGTVFDIKEFGIHDGPGLRTTVFLKGCPLRCKWCHNPEGLSPHPQLSVREHACTHCGLCKRGCSHPDCQPFGRCLHICPQNLVTVIGERLSSEQLAQRVLRNRDLFGEQGGVTFSGGEPLLQGEFVIETCGYLDGIHKAIETSGYADEDLFRRVIKQMDLVYFDLKLTDEEEHRKYTGVSNRKIKRNFEILKESGKPCIIRTPLIPNITDTAHNMDAIRAMTTGMNHEWLPYNEMAGAKYDLLGMTYPMDEMK